MTEHQCPVCSHSYASLSTLQIHVESHFQDDVPEALVARDSNVMEDLQAVSQSQDAGVEIIRDESGRVIYYSRVESVVEQGEEDIVSGRGKRRTSRGEVDSHGSSNQETINNDADDDTTCLLCGSTMIDMSTKEKNEHLNECLDGMNGKESEMIPLGDGKGGARHSSDIWWNELDGDLAKLPKNFSPGVIPVLQKILANSHNQGITRHAVLCSDSVVHIQCQRGFDGGWGCGYRNALMLLTSVVSSNPQYQCVYAPSGSDTGPGVQMLQQWLEEAWREGYDQDGKNQLKGSVVGTNKWIGTSDIYALLSRQGIPCKLYDFPKASGAKFFSASSTHSALVAFVRKYFDEPDPVDDAGSKSTASAFEVLMQSQGASSTKNVRMTKKMPLILQHSGHSRTIVGYEENKQGNINILMYDPGRPMRADIRESGIRGLIEKRGGITQGDQKEDEAQPLHRKEYTQVEIDAQVASFGSDTETDGSQTQPQANGSKRPFLNSQEEQPLKRTRSDDGRSDLRPDERMTKAGWIKKKVHRMPLRSKNGNGAMKSAERDRGPPDWVIKPIQALAGFRINLSTLSRNTEYQVLMITGGPLLTSTERLMRRTVHGTAIYK